MARINPDTFVKLIHTELTPEHQLTFSSLEEQQRYFDNLSGLVLSDFTYQRKDNVIRYPQVFDDLEKYNYVMYKNTDYDNKYYYAYITELKYINDNMTEIRIETDVFQTWQFDFIYKKSFVERKHVTDDVAGRYTIAEPVATGEFVVNNVDYYDDMNDFYYVIQVTELISPWSGYPVNDECMTNFGKIPMTGYCFMTDDITEYRYIIATYNQAEKISAVYNTYMIPKIAVDPRMIANLVYLGQPAPMNYTYSINKPTMLDSYAPKNKKLLTYPYCYILMSNNNGSNNVLQYEKFTEYQDKCDFIISCLPTPNGSIKCTPDGYARNQAYIEEEGIMAGKYPTLNWNQDNYADWLLTNSASLNTQKTQGRVTASLGGASLGISLGTLVGMGIAGVLSGGALAGLGGGVVAGIGGIASGYFQVQNAINQDYEHSLIPDSAVGLASGGDINVASDNAGFFFYHYSIKREFAQMIDDYFSMYGYKVNSMEVPNLHTRRNWNYLKILDVNLESVDVPEVDVNKYKQMLQNGITFWHNPATFRDYSQTNNNV